MGEVSTIGLDIAKQVFQAHGADASGHVVFRKRLTRAKLLGVLRGPAALRGGDGGLRRRALLGARDRQSWAITVRLIPPAYVKPFVKRQKNDAADAEAICEAAQRPSMRFVPVKRRGAAGERRRVPGPGSAGASAHAVHQRLAWASRRIRLRCSPGHHPCRDADRSRSRIRTTALPESARDDPEVLIGTFRALESRSRSWMREINRRSQGQTRSHAG